MTIRSVVSKGMLGKRRSARRQRRSSMYLERIESRLLLSVFTNGDFEAGDFTGWTQSGGSFYGYWNPDITYPGSYTYTGGPYQSAIVSQGNDPTLASYGIQVSRTFGDSYAGRINSLDGGNYHFSQISQTANAWNSPYLYFAFSAILAEPGHAHKEEPHFRIMLDDLTTGQQVYNLFYASDTLPATLD